jgi:hypothetical protein
MTNFRILNLFVKFVMSVPSSPSPSPWLSSVCQNKQILHQLTKCNIITVSDFLTTDSTSLCKCVGLTTQDYKSLLQSITNTFASPMYSALQLFYCEQNQTYIYRTCAWLDLLLGGGLHSNDIVELIGDTATGKTQICIFVAICVVVPEIYLPKSPIESELFGIQIPPPPPPPPPPSPLSPTVLFIDTTNSVVPARFCDYLLPRLKRLHLLDDNTFIGNDFISELPTIAKHSLQNLRLFSCCDADELLMTLKGVIQQVESKRNTFYRQLQLLILDSLGVVVTGSYPFIKKRKVYLSELARTLRFMSTELHIRILYTNYLVGQDDHRYPALSPTFLSVPTTQIHTSKGNQIESERGEVRDCFTATLRRTRFMSCTPPDIHTVQMSFDIC